MTAQLQDEVQQRYKIAAQTNPSCALEWHNKGLSYTNYAQDYVKNELQPQVLQIYRSITQTHLLFFSNIRYANLFFLCTEPLSAWYALYTQHLRCLAQEADDLIGNTYKSAIQYFHQAINACDSLDFSSKNKIKSDLIECLAQYGHYLYKNECYQKAQKYYSQAIKLDPDHITALNQMGMCLSKEELYAQARTYFEEIIKRINSQQEQADAWLNIASTYRLQQNYPKSAKTLREAQRLAPNDPDILAEEKRLRVLVSSTAFSSNTTRKLFNRYATAQSQNSQDAASDATFEFSSL